MGLGALETTRFGIVGITGSSGCAVLSELDTVMEGEDLEFCAVDDDTVVIAVLVGTISLDFWKDKRTKEKGKIIYSILLHSDLTSLLSLSFSNFPGG